MDATTSTPATSMASLPQVIILKILTGLPPKSAVSFRCTSKFFHSLIPQPHFAFTILFSFPSANLYTVGYTTEESHGRLRPNSLQCSEKLQRFKEVVGSSFADGKLCLLNTHGEITLWDLSTRQHISLRRTLFEFRRGPGPPPGPILGGFDPISKKHEVWKSEIFCNTHHIHHLRGMLWVLTLGVDQLWRLVTIYSFVPGKLIASVQIDGIIYFINYKINCEDKPEIGVFNIEAGDLRVIPFPYIFKYLCATVIYSSWVKLNGRLAYIYVHLKGLRTNIYVCTLEKSMTWEMHKIALRLEECKIFSEAESVSFTTNGIGEIVFLIRARGMPPSILIYACGRQVWRKFKISALTDYEHAVENLRSFVHVIEEKTYFFGIN